jgi:hypothetical protein
MVDLLEEYGFINPIAVAAAKTAKREKLKRWSDLTKL